MRSSGIAAITLIHTAIFALVSTCALHVFAAGVFGRPARWTGAAILIVVAEPVVFLANHGHCPLTDLAEGIGAESDRVTDIVLPRWFADRIPQIYTPLFCVGVFALLWRRPPARHGSIVTARPCMHR